jgi:hypothetical protein
LQAIQTATEAYSYAKETSMKRAERFLHWATLAFGGALFSGGCLPDNFWADKGAEIVNRSIFAVINLVLEPSGIAL